MDHNNRMNTATDTARIHLYVNMPGHNPYFTTVSEALNSLPQTVQEKEYPAPPLFLPPVTIHIGSGIYREKLTVARPGVTLQGEGSRPEDVILIYGDGALDLMPEGDKRGTFRTASVFIDAPDFTAKHLTFQNNAGYSHKAGQALALYVDGDRCLFEDCVLLGSQDTLFTAPLPPAAVVPDGFKGPGQFKPRVMGRHCFRNCHIQGDVDFIFGSAVVWFENCEIFSKMAEGRKPSLDPEGQEIYGYVTAASTPEGEPYGYVFKDCRLLGDCPAHSVYLGRPWREWARTVFLHCELGAHIHPAGWHDWNRAPGTFYYGEYDSYGPGASPATRASFSHQLTEKEAADYTLEHVLKGWQP